MPQLVVGFKFDQFHKMFNDQIALKFFVFFFCQRPVPLSMYQFVCSYRGIPTPLVTHSSMLERVTNGDESISYEVSKIQGGNKQHVNVSL